MLSLGLGLSGFSGVLSWPELQLSTRAAGVNVPMACAAKVLSLGLGMGLGLDWVGSLWASSSKEKRHGNETVAQG